MQMLPSYSSIHTRDRFTRDLVELCDASVRVTPGESSEYVTRPCLCQSCLRKLDASWNFLKSKATRMLLIFEARQVLQVRVAIVVLMRVFMIYLAAVWTWAYECCGNESVHILRTRFTVFAESDDCVSVSVCAGFENAPRDCISISSAYALHTSLIADLVPAFVTNNCPPMFFRHNGVDYPRSV